LPSIKAHFLDPHTVEVQGDGEAIRVQGQKILMPSAVIPPENLITIEEMARRLRPAVSLEKVSHLRARSAVADLQILSLSSILDGT
jgi:hypothetical protein